MSFAVAFGIDIAVNAFVLGATLLPPSQSPKVRIGTGSVARGSSEEELTGGHMPDIHLYDTHGQMMAYRLGGDVLDAGQNPEIDFGVDPLNPGLATKSPEYLRLQARGDDATCISYVAATSTGLDKRTWHAGYAKECSRHMEANFWYPSPEIIPTTDFRPGCIWISGDDRFVQGISVKLTDFAFPTSEAAEKAKKQFEETPNTLCQAPGRMTFWKTTDRSDCIPFYDFDVEKDETTGRDVDYQEVVSGHTVPCRLKGTAFKQVLQPGMGPITKSPDQVQQEAGTQRVQQELSDNGQNPNGPAPGAGNFGGVTGTMTQEEVNESGKNSDAPLPGTGSFGGIGGTIPPDKVGEFVNEVTPLPTRHRRGIRREQARTRDYCTDQLVISHIKEHSAIEVCEMNSSWGPDFVSTHEGWHCDMCTRQLSRLCGSSSSNEERCFDLNERTMTLHRTQDGVLGVGQKRYAKVSEWSV